VRLIILGEGAPAFETALMVTAKKFPTKFAYQKEYDETVAHLIQAGMDISLIPSRFEPAGLGAMYNLKYGALPVARVTGGIQEIIEEYDPTTDSGYGFVCYEYSSDAFWDAMKWARQIFRDQPLWTKLMKRAMTRNFSWDVSAQHYEALYRELVAKTDETAAYLEPVTPSARGATRL
jgi:starch synthase